jgi:mannose-1-phosphate guanylyltransferase
MPDLSHCPALVLTAGLATRLRPLSDVRAKAAMPVAGTPIISRILRWLRTSGIRRVVLNLHHRPETITSIVGDGRQFDLEVRYSWEPVVLGSAGGPRRALPLLDADSFLIVNGDTLTDCDLGALAAFHETTGARVTMAVVDGDVARYGGVLVEEGSRVVGFGAPRDGAQASHFIGVQMASANVFAALPDDQPSESVKTVYPQVIAARAGDIAAWHSRAEFLDVGTARDYLQTVAIVAGREGRAYDVGADCRIASDAHLARTVLWDRVHIGAGAWLVDCVVADGVSVPAGAQHEGAVLVP